MRLDIVFYDFNDFHNRYFMTSFRPDLMVEQIESPKKFNMKKVTIVDEEEARNTRKSRPKQTRKIEPVEQPEDSDDSGIFRH